MQGQEYFGTSEQIELLKRSEALWNLLKHDRRFSYYGRTVSLVEPGEDAAEVYDRFLDCYSEWKAAPGPETLEVLNEAVAGVKSMDPDFAFQLPTLTEEPGSND